MSVDKHIEKFAHKWTARAVGSHLKRYGLTTNKTGGRRIYGRVTLDDLRRIQSTYNTELGFDDEQIELDG